MCGVPSSESFHGVDPELHWRPSGSVPAMASRFTYSRWDGTQIGFDLDADRSSTRSPTTCSTTATSTPPCAADAAGLPRPQRRRAPGPARAARAAAPAAGDELERDDLGGVYDDIAQELREVVDKERHALDASSTRPPQSGDERRPGAGAARRRRAQLRLDMLPNDLAGMVAGWRSTTSSRPRRSERFEQLIDKLREQLMQRYVDQMSGRCRIERPRTCSA